MSEFRKALDKYARYVVQQSRSNLTKQRNNASKSLYRSLGYNIKGNQVTFEGNEYGEFLDKGVRGAESYYADKGTASSPFKYKGKMPPPKAFEKWIRQRGIKGRDKKTGRFITNQSLSYLIARSIYKKGIRATLFFTKPFEAGFVKYEYEIMQGYLDDKLNLQ
tara:strand:+ start:14734 stop:15222 length:489 start_codon:yes stop_codon:yes gene_type:complete